MPFSHLRNRHHRIRFAYFFIAVLTIHVAVIQSVWSTRDNTRENRDKINFLESFTIQTQYTVQADDAVQADEAVQADHVVHINHAIQATDAIQGKDVLLEPEGIKTPKAAITKNIKPPHTTRKVNAVNHQTKDLQTSTTSPVADANVLNNPPPLYPRQSRRRGEQGKVVLAAEIASNGKALQALVHVSSGYPRLDQAALESVLKWQFIPGKKAGVPQVMWINIPINFVLE